MHDILEGVLQYEIKLMLQVMVNREKYFTLTDFNSQLENLELGYMESKNCPTQLSSKTLNSDSSSLKQNGLYIICNFITMYSSNFSFTNEFNGTYFTTYNWRFYT